MLQRLQLDEAWSRGFPTHEDDPALRLEPHAEHARQARALEAITRLRGKHFVQEDAPQEIAGHVARLIEAGA